MNPSALPSEWRQQMQAYQQQMMELQARVVPPPTDVPTVTEPRDLPFLLQQEQTETQREQPTPPIASEGQEMAELLVRTYTAEGALPVAGALVRVYAEKAGERTLLYAVRTDEDGMSPWLSLAGEDPALTQQPTPSASPTQSYWVLVDKQGYYSEWHEHLILYRGIRSRQSVDMVPLPVGTTDAPPRIYYSESPNL